jgi:hypothetical protein
MNTRSARLVYTLSPMTEAEAQQFGISEFERRHLIRMDSAKVNIAPPAPRSMVGASQSPADRPPGSGALP